MHHTEVQFEFEIRTTKVKETLWQHTGSEIEIDDL